MLRYEALSSDNEEEEERADGTLKYTCWFVPNLLSKIELGLKLHTYKFEQL